MIGTTAAGEFNASHSGGAPAWSPGGSVAVSVEGYPGGIALTQVDIT